MKLCSRKIDQFIFMKPFEKVIPYPDKFYTFSYVFQNIIFKNSGRAVLTSACRWRTQGLEMMWNARLSTIVVKPDFTEHTSMHSEPTWLTEFIILMKEIIHFSWSWVTSLVVSRLLNINNSIFQLNCMHEYISTL